MNTTIVKMLHGSHLYGLNTPNSDQDWKGIFMPSIGEVLLKGPDAHHRVTTKEGDGKNTKDDVDQVYFSLVNFFGLASKGEMIAHDMLAAPADWPVEDHLMWESIRRARHLFYSKDMRAYMGYVRKQTAKYGFKGSRLDALQKVIANLEKFSAEERLEVAFDQLVLDGEYARIIQRETSHGNLDEYYEVLGSAHGKRVKIGEILRSMKSREKEYGHRARAALTNEGVDWKAVSHAFRAAHQLIQLFQDGEMILPLRPEVIREVLPIKLGAVAWLECQDRLEALTETANSLSEKSSFPERVDMAEVEALTLDLSFEFYGIDR